VINSRPASPRPAGYRFPQEVIAVAVRWYLRYGLSYRDVEELLAERGIEVDHVTIYRWVQTFTPEFIDAARPAPHATGTRWYVDETYVKIAAAGPTSTAPSISTVRSSTSWSANAATPLLHGRSSPAP
jgi:transposase-like protein